MFKRLLLVVLLTAVSCGKPDRLPQSSTRPAFDPEAFGPRDAPPEAPIAREIADFGPTGDDVTGIGQFHVRFTAPMRPLGVAAEQASDELAVSIDGEPLAGHAYWQTPDRLVFDAAVPVPPASEITVAFAGVASIPAKTWVVRTARPTIRLAKPRDGAGQVARTEPILLETSFATSLASLKEHVQLTADGKRVAFTLRAATAAEATHYSQPARLVVVEHDPFEVGAKVQVSVTAGWRSAVGKLPAAASHTGTFAVHPPLALVDVPCAGASCGPQPITIGFSTPIDPSQYKKIDVRPRPKRFKVNDEWGGSQRVSIDGYFLPGVKYEVTVDGALKDVFGQVLGKSAKRAVEFTMPQPAVYFDHDSGDVLDDGVPRASFSTRHVKRVRIDAVMLDDATYAELLRLRSWHEDALPPLSELGEVVSRTVDVDLIGPTNWGSTPFRVEKLFRRRGPVVAQVTPVEMVAGYEIGELSDRAVFRYGSLVPIAHLSSNRGVLRVEDAQTQRAAVDAEITSYGHVNPTKLGTLPEGTLLEVPREAHGTVLVARTPDGDFGSVYLDESPPMPTVTWLKRAEKPHVEAVTDRGIYRPGDEVYVAGWSVIDTPHHPWGQRPLPPDTKVHLELLDAQNTPISDVELTTTGGRFNGVLTLPKSARLGTARLNVTFESGGSAIRPIVVETIKIGEFRNPDFETTAEPDKRDLVGDEALTVVATSRYLSGTRTRITESRAEVDCGIATPPGPADWWVGVNEWRGYSFGHTAAVEVTGVGEARLSARNLGDKEGATRSCNATVTLRNPSFQEAQASTRVLVHPSPHYIGVRRIDDRVAGEAASIDLAAFDIRGDRIASDEVVDLNVTLHQRTPVTETSGDATWVTHYEDHERSVKKCRTRAGSSCRLDRLESGRYTIEGTSRQDANRRFKVQFWVDAAEPPANITVDLDADASVARIRTTSAAGTLLVERSGILHAVGFKTRKGVAEVKLPSSPAWAPRVQVRATAVDYGTSPPSLMEATQRLDVDADFRNLQVSVKAPPSAMVRQSVDVQVAAQDSLGAPVQGRALIWAVDDALLQLTDYTVPNLAQAFYPVSGPPARSYETLAYLLSPFVRQIEDRFESSMLGLMGSGSGSGFGSGRGGVGLRGAPRSDFRATPLFLGEVPIVAGKGSATFKLPDSMTRFRVMSIVASPLEGTDAMLRFGTGETTLNVGAPVVLRPALPRFIRPGDTAKLAAIVQNSSGKDGVMAVKLEIDGESLEWVTAVSATREAMKNGSERAFAFEARAVSEGRSHITMTATLTPDDGSAPHTDAVRIPLQSSVEPTLVETVATYGTIDADQSVGIPIVTPTDVYGETGGVSVTLTSTLLGGLKDATDQLIRYPYGCAEQTASRMLPLVALADLKGFVAATELPKGESVDAFVDAGIVRLLGMQRSDGGFGYWPTAEQSSPYVSAYVLWVLTLAQQAGHAVAPESLESARKFLISTLASGREDLPDSMGYYSSVRRALAVFALGSDAPMTAVNELLAAKELPVFARAFVMAALHARAPEDTRLPELRRELLNTLTETPGSASVVESVRYNLTEYFHSDLRSSAIALIVLMRMAPDDARVAKLARGLMEKRYRGAWRNTQENAYALVGLAEYARKYESDEPNFGAVVRTDHAVLLEDRWTGRSMKEKTASLPMAALLQLGTRSPNRVVPLEVGKRGAGRMYYRLGMTYAPKSPVLPAIQRGLAVKRTFRWDDEPVGVSFPKQVDAGDVVAVDLEVTSQALTRFVALDMPVPAGFEPIDLSLATNKAMPMGGHYGWWVSHREHHTDRVVYFADTLQPGQHVVTAYLRATTSGTFNFPPTHATAMYTPEVFGRSDGGTVTID